MGQSSSVFKLTTVHMKKRSKQVVSMDHPLAIPTGIQEAHESANRSSNNAIQCHNSAPRTRAWASSGKTSNNGAAQGGLPFALSPVPSGADNGAAQHRLLVPSNGVSSTTSKFPGFEDTETMSLQGNGALLHPCWVTGSCR